MLCDFRGTLDFMKGGWRWVFVSLVLLGCRNISTDNDVEFLLIRTLRRRNISAEDLENFIFFLSFPFFLLSFLF